MNFLMVGIVLFISLVFNVLMLIQIEDKEEEQQLTEWDNDNLKEWLWKEQQKVQMLKEECDTLRNELHKEQLKAKNKQIAVTVDVKAVTEKVMKEINRKIAKMKKKDFR